MPLRIVELVRLGDFRLALKAGVLGLDWPEGFAALESTAVQVRNELVAIPYEQFATGGPDDFAPLPQPNMEGHWGGTFMGVTPVRPDGSLTVLLRCSLGFSRWPLGYWVFFDGFEFDGERRLSFLSDEQLGQHW